MPQSLSHSSTVIKAATAEAVCVFPASFAQQRLWFLNQLVPGNPFYNVSANLRLVGPLNVPALEQTFNEIVQRHEILRTTFEMIEGELQQVIASSARVPLAIGDLQALPASERQAVAAQRALAAAQQPFDLSAGPLLRVQLLQLDATDHLLLLNLHHIVTDGWSMGVLIRELGALYSAFNAGKPAPLPELSIQYADFAHWQRQWLQGEVLELQLAYWRQQLADLPVLNLPTDRPRPTVQSYRGATQQLELPQDLSKSLAILSQRSGVTLFMTLLAAFQTLLYRYTRQVDIPVGSPIANRSRSELEGLIGCFVNNLVLRTDLSGNPTFEELLLRVRQVALEAYAHQDLPFEKLVQELHPERDLSHHPLFQVAIALQNTPIEALELPGLSLNLWELDSGTTRLDLEIHFWETPAGLRGQAIYSTDLFDRSSIARLLAHLQTLLAAIVSDPQQRLSDLPLLTVAEQQLLGEWNRTQDYATDATEQCFHQLFESQTELTPEAIAVVFGDEQLTYQALNSRSNQLAHYLQKRGVAPEVLVGIYVERSLEMVVGVLGVLKAGGAYVPIDPACPPERLRLILEDAQVSLLLTQQCLLGGVSQDVAPVCLDRDWQTIAQESQEAPSSTVTLANLAYMIYTSGSTGKPKGVLVQHGGLSNLAAAQIQVFNLQPECRILQFAALSFDAAIFEIVMALQIGATLYLAPKSALAGAALVQLLQDNAITHATLPPAVLMNLPVVKLPALQTLISAGESCSQTVAARWAGDRHFYNAYGLTETTVWATVATVTDSSRKPSLGRAIANTQGYVLDANLQPVPIGIPGELYLSGVGLARGYLNRPDLTAERFIPNPFGNEGSRLYQTGDWVRYQPDGLEFLGRTDHQVKIRGHRIELGDVEAALSQHPSVQTAVVTTHKDGLSQQLVAYIVFQTAPTPTVGDLRRFLKEKLPAYMVPSAFIVQSSLPLTSSGKVNRSALPQPNRINRGLAPAVAPRTPTEAALAKLWAETLNLEQVGIHDNFFELGGDSLQATCLMQQVQQQFERKLPLSDLFLAPTIEQFALLLQRNDGDTASQARPWSPLVPLQPVGSKLPLFCVHPIFGVVLPYHKLAYQLGPDQPFYGLQPYGLDGVHPPCNRIEEMAAHYIEAVRQVQPHGPYQLGGWSFGGLVAFEMAQQLHRAGQQVSLLAILDTLAPVASNQPSCFEGFRFLLTTVARSIRPFLLDYWLLIRRSYFHSSVGAASPMENRSPNFLNSVLQRIGISRTGLSASERVMITHLIPPEAGLRLLDELTLHRMLRIYYANSRAALSYRPQPYPNSMALFRTCDPSRKTTDSTLGWSELATGGVDVNQVPGNHLTMLREPSVQVLAERLQHYLARDGRDGLMRLGNFDRSFPR